MIDNDSPRSKRSRHAAGRLAVGDCMEIRRGSLTGLAGQITGFTADYRCILKIDGWDDGAYVIIAGSLLTRIEEESRASSDAI